MIARALAIAITGAAALALLVVSIAINMRFGAYLGTTELDQLIFAGASGAADILKAAIPLILISASRQTRILAIIFGACLWLVFSAYSLTSSLGFAALNRGEVAAQRTDSATRHQTDRARLARLEQQLFALPPTAPAEALAAKLNGVRTHARWAATSQCTNATVDKSRAFCAQYHKLSAELAIATNREALEARLTHLRNTMANSNHMSLGNPTPQISLLHELSGLTEDKVRLTLIVLLALLVELGSGLGPYLVATLASGLPPSPPQGRVPAELLAPDRLALPRPVPQMDDWRRLRLVEASNLSDDLIQLYRDYRKWCAAYGRRDGLTLSAFTDWLQSKGFAIEAEAARRHVRGARLRT